MAQLRWLSRQALDEMHRAQLREHGGRAGVRDAGLIDSALARPRNKATYGRKVGIALLAAAYGYGLARNHGYVDGIKRVAFVAMAAFLRLNGYELSVDEPDVVRTIERLAAGRLTERALASWIRKHIVRPTRSR